MSWTIVYFCSCKPYELTHEIFDWNEKNVSVDATDGIVDGCTCSDSEALSPVLTVEGGQIQGVKVENTDV